MNSQNSTTPAKPETIHDLLAASLTGPLTSDYRLVQTACPSATDEALYMANWHMLDAEAAGKRWSWREAQGHLDAAYAALGAVNPGSGADWHAGRHPIQQSRFHPLAGEE